MFLGSPQLLGVFHLITLFYLLHKNNNKWAFLSFIAVIFSTSKTRVCNIAFSKLIIFIL
ncbi:MAG: hypothetical protein Ct9H90mP3_7670 [Flammeovirgaceae bacterium]|nr:MAG: hypothetical protein Ct9H90mP3_7670 [Flammeovirgaceae bacterium]